MTDLILPSEITIEYWDSRPSNRLLYNQARGVKITHIPTGLVICNDLFRSQHECKQAAIEELKSYLIKINWNREKNPSLCSKWKPIEFAPKDNKRLLYLARFVNNELRELDFNGSWEYWQESWEMSHINGWYWESEIGIEEPTHWSYQDEEIPIMKQKQDNDVYEKLELAIEHAKMSSDPFEFLVNQIAAMKNTEFSVNKTDEGQSKYES